MQNDLIMNYLPLPKYFDGHQWNTVIRPTRASIPKYLHQNLPQLRHLYIKQIFKDMGKINCPNLQFFNTMIKKKSPTQKKQRRSSSQASQNKSISYNQIKQQLQYALIVMDRQSNIIDDLVQKAQHVKKPAKSKNKQKLALPSFRSTQTNPNSLNKLISSISENKPKTKTKYFDNTVDLVFRNRRNSYIQNLKKEKEIEEIPQAYQRRFKEMKLIQIDNPNL